MNIFVTNECPACSKKVFHDAYGKPNNPEEYMKILRKQDGDKT